MPKRRAATQPLRLATIAVAVLASILARAPAAWAADVRVDRFDLVTHGGIDESSGRFEAGSRLYFDMVFAGGDKFAGLLRMDMLSGQVEKDLAALGSSFSGTPTLTEAVDKIKAGLSPRLRTASVTAKGMFGLPMDMSYFVGQLDNFGSGDDFVPLFGTAAFTTELRGPMVYPEGIGGDSDRFYEGIHTVNGTGFRIGTSSKLSSRSIGYAYVYQDSDIGVGAWSADLRALFNYEKVKIELFSGASLSSAVSSGIYRAGMLFFAAPGDVGEFFAQVGMPYFDPGSGFSVDNIYFLFEPRINYGFGNLALTVFYHPAYYRQRTTGDSEKSALDMSFNLKFGRLSAEGVQGGVQSLFALRSYTSTPLAVDLAPYYSVISGGIQWDFKLSLRLFPVPSRWYGIFRPFIGLKTSF